MRKSKTYLAILILIIIGTSGYYLYSKNYGAADPKVNNLPVNISLETWAMIRAEINGQPIFSDAPARRYEQDFLLPIAPIAKILGYQCEWQQASKSIVVYNDIITLEFAVGSNKATIDETEISLPYEVTVDRGVTLVPLKLLEALQITCHWDQEEKVLRCKTPDYVLTPSGETEPQKSDSYAILMYHEIGEGPNNLFVRESEFKEQMQYLAYHGYKVLSLKEAVTRQEKQENMEKVVVITFDDGYESFYDKVWPVLREYGFPATVFVITDNCQDNPRYITWGQMQFLQANWMDVGSHTKTHPALPNLNIQSLNQEVLGSKELIEKNLSYPCFSFCYPTGAYNKQVVEAVINAGYGCAVTINYGKSTLYHENYLQPRIRVPRGMTIESFASAIR